MRDKGRNLFKAGRKITVSLLTAALIVGGSIGGLLPGSVMEVQADSGDVQIDLSLDGAPCEGQTVKLYQNGEEKCTLEEMND